jgi:glycosyltransferase involved in cell wall biosynthesis
MKGSNTQVRFPLEAFSRSGGMRVIIGIANALAEEGIRVELVAPDFSAQPPWPLHRDVTLTVISTTALPHRIRQLQWFQWLAVHGAEGCDVVVATFWRTMYWLSASRRLQRRPPLLVNLVQGDDARSQILERQMSGLVKRLLFPIAQRSVQLPSETVMVSSWLQQSLRRQGQVIPNGVDRSVFFPALPAPAPRTNFVVGAVARATAQKGWGALLDTCERLVQRTDMNARFVFAAPADLPVQEISPALLQRLTIVEPRDDASMRSFYQSLDAFVFCSMSEGFGLPPLEAMACGVPVVSTDCGGVREFMDGQNGVLVPVGQPALLADALYELWRQPAYRLLVRDLGLTTASHFSTHVQMQRYVHYFRGLLTA